MMVRAGLELYSEYELAVPFIHPVLGGSYTSPTMGIRTNKVIARKSETQKLDLVDF